MLLRILHALGLTNLADDDIAKYYAAKISNVVQSDNVVGNVSAGGFADTHIVQIGNVSAGRDAVVVGGDISFSADDRRARAERKIDEAQTRVQEWGQRISTFGWDRQAWDFLGFALQRTHEAIEIDPNYQRAWTLLADIYHRIGKIELAKQCLGKSYSLAEPGPNPMLST